MRKYLAMCDDGHDYMEFEYYSDYRNHSKKNLEDARKTLLKQYGYSTAKRFKIKDTVIWEY